MFIHLDETLVEQLVTISKSSFYFITTTHQMWLVGDVWSYIQVFFFLYRLVPVAIITKVYSKHTNWYNGEVLP